jgi:hypothetical protein
MDEPEGCRAGHNMPNNYRRHIFNSALDILISRPQHSISPQPLLISFSMMT